MAHPTAFEIVITGKGGHGSQPQFAVDPVLTAAHVIIALQSIVSRNVASKEEAVVSVTMVHGGEVSRACSFTPINRFTLINARSHPDDVLHDLS